MTDYARRELEKINPCGIEGQSSTHCRYVSECTAFGRSSGSLICLSQMGYQVAGYLLGGSGETTERRDLREHLSHSIGMNVVDPRKEKWEPKRFESSDLGTVTDEIVSRGQGLSNLAIGRGADKNPLNFDCKPEDIAADLF